MWTRFDQKDLEKFIKNVITSDIKEIELEVGTMAEFEFDLHVKDIKFKTDLPEEIKNDLCESLKFAFAAGAKFGAIKQIEKCIEISRK